MLLSALFAALLLLVQTPEAGSDRNVFVDLGAEHCAEEVAMSAFENTEAAELAAADAPAFVTYSAYEFGTAERANAAMDDLHVMVAETFSDDPDITERDDFDDIVAEVPTEELGDRAVSYVMNLPVEGASLDVLFVNMLGIIEESQLMAILMFGEGGGEEASPGLSAEAILPFTDVLEENWDGTGDLQDAVPSQDDMPIGWEGRDVVLEDPPSCE